MSRARRQKIGALIAASLTDRATATEGLPMKREDALLKLAETMGAGHAAPAVARGSDWPVSGMDLVCIEGFEGQTVIGLDPNEWHAPQTVRIDLMAGVPHCGACASDRIGDTIDYGAVRLALLALMRTHRHQLLEAFAEEIAQILLARFGAHWVRVKVVKPRKFPDVEAVGVVIERRAARGAFLA
jgi:dihydroneopterin aldolase